MKKIKAYLNLVVLTIISIINATAITMFIIEYWPGKLTVKFIWVGLILLTFFGLMFWLFFDCLKNHLKIYRYFNRNRQKVGIARINDDCFVVHDIKTLEVIEGSKFPDRGGCLNFIAAYPNLYRFVDKPTRKY